MLGDALVVVNDTKVVPARIPIEQPKGEVLLLERLDDDGLGRGSRGRPGVCGRGAATGRSSCSSSSERDAGGCGSTASLPARRRCRRTSPSRSPTRRATRPCTRATPARPRRRRPGCTSRREVLARLDVERVTLHVGLDTFRPVAVEDLDEHSAPRRALRGRARGVGADPRRPAGVLAVGTTTVRVLETLARGGAARPAAPSSSSRPGFDFRRTDALLTNFHLPALDAARARDGVRGSRGDARGSTGRRSSSATASTPSAMRCSCCERPPRTVRRMPSSSAALLDEATEWVGRWATSQWPLAVSARPARRRDRARRGVSSSRWTDGESVATVAILLDDPTYWGERPPDAFYVHKLAVRRDQAGRGIGAAVVEWAHAEAAEAGREFLRLDCLRRQSRHPRRTTKRSASSTAASSTSTAAT